jgi:hypothetical protein
MSFRMSAPGATVQESHHQFNHGHNKKSESFIRNIRIWHIMHMVSPFTFKAALFFILYHSRPAGCRKNAGQMYRST